MDYEEKKRKQFIRVLVAEIGMVIAALAIVVVATMAAMGFFISSDGQIQQSGLMQLHSIPTGATVKLDGEVLFSRTNLSRMVTAGEHTIELSRNRYDTWAKTVSMRSGALMRLYYPRIFLQDRTAETMIDFKKAEKAEKSLVLSDLELYSPSRSRNYMLYAMKGSSSWHLLDLRGNELKDVVLEMGEVLPGMVELSGTPLRTSAKAEPKKAYEFKGRILDTEWSNNDERVLMKVEADKKVQWVLVNLRDPAKSLNLTKAFGLDFDEITILDGAASQLYALENHNLRKINAADGKMSKVLLSGIEEFSSSGANLIYLTGVKESALKSSQVLDAKEASEVDKPKEMIREIGVYRDNEEGSTVLLEVAAERKVQIALSRYYEEDHVCFIINDKLTVLRGALPNYNEKAADFSTLKPYVEQVKLSYIPDRLTVSPDGEYLVAQKDTEMMVADLYTGDLTEYNLGVAELNWLDASMMYDVKNKAIKVWDFDGTNLRNLTQQARNIEGLEPVVADGPVVVTGNNRWMYYFDIRDSLRLVRERIVE